MNKKELELLKQRGLMFRSAAINSKIIDKENRSIRTVVATENPSIVIDWDRYQLIREVLIISKKSVIMPEDKQLPFLDSHLRSSTDDLKGSIRDLRIEDSELVGDTYFSSVEENIWTKAMEGHLTDVSVGYKTFPEYTTIIKPDEKAKIAGRVFLNDYPDKLDLVIREKWQPREGSGVVIGADDKAKFREEFMNALPDETIIPLDIEGSESVKQQIEKFNKSNSERGLKIILTNNKRSEPKMTEEEKKALAEKEAAERAERDKQLAKDRAEARESETLRVRNIYAVAEDFQKNIPGINLKEEANKYVAEGKSDNEFRQFVMKKLKDPEATRTPDTQLGMGEKEKERYSLRKVILALADKDVDKLGIELEASREIAKKLNKDQTKSNIFVPYDIQTKSLPDLSRDGRRDLVVGTDASGGYTVHKEYPAGSFIEILMNGMVMPKLGVTIMEGLTGDVPMTRELSSNIFYWVAEGSGPTQSDITFGQSTMTPKTGGALTKFSHKFLLQNSIGGEAYVARKLAIATAIGYDKAALYGVGATQPLGLKNQTGLGSVVGAGFTRAKALEMIRQIKTANALTLGVPKFLTDFITSSTLQQIDTTNGYGKWLMDEGKMVNYSAIDHNQVDAGDLFAGVWNALILGMWGVVEIKANEFGAGFAAGDIEVRTLVDMDVFVEYPGAFSLASGVTA